MTIIEGSMKVEETEDISDKQIGLAWVRRNSLDLSAKPEIQTTHTHGRIRPVTEGNALISLLVEMVEHSDEIVCLSSFLLQKSELTDSLLRAHERGVRVYILTAGEEDLKVTDEDGSPSVERVKEFRLLLSSLSENVFLRTADFHAKFVIIDPFDGNARGVLTTSNLTNDAMSGVNKELYVVLSADEVFSFFNQFLFGVWVMARHELSDGRLRELQESRYMPEASIPSPTHPATLPGNKTLYETIKKLISGAHREIIVTAWTFSDEEEIPTLLSDSLDRGVKVRVYTRPNYLNSVTLSKLVQKGAEVLAHERFHAKALIVDNEKSIVMTANFAVHGLEDGFEAAIELDKQDTKLLSGILEEWDVDCGWKLSLSANISSLFDTVKLVNKETQEIRDIVIESERTVPLPQIKLSEIRRRDEIKLKAPIDKTASDRIVKKTTYRAEVLIPSLPKGSTRLDGLDEKFEVFRNSSKSEFFITISEWESLDEAREIARKYNAKVVKPGLEGNN